MALTEHRCGQAVREGLSALFIGCLCVSGVPVGEEVRRPGTSQVPVCI